MQPHQERVVTEKNQLDEKIDKLDTFSRRDNFPNASRRRAGQIKQAAFFHAQLFWSASQTASPPFRKLDAGDHHA